MGSLFVVTGAAYKLLRRATWAGGTFVDRAAAGE